MSNAVKDALTDDHTPIPDALLARRYFAKFNRIVGHLGRVAAELEAEGRLTRAEAIRLAVTATRQFAKRQTTWFRHRMADWTWIAPV